MTDQAHNSGSDQLTHPVTKNTIEIYNEDENFPYPREFMVPPPVWTSLHHQTMIKVMTQGLEITKNRYKPIRKEFDALSADDKLRRREEFELRLVPIGKTLMDFEQNDETNWMFQARSFSILGRMEKGPAKDLKKRAAAYTMTYAFEIVTILVSGLDTALVNKPYLTEKDGFFDFEAYVESGQEMVDPHGRCLADGWNFPFASVVNRD